MDGIHDLGGRDGFGPVVRETDEPVFHERWEAGVFAMAAAAILAGAGRNADQFRHAIERIDPRAYLTHGYYGRWLGGLETLFVEAGLIGTDEITERARARGARPEDLVAARPDARPGPQPAPPSAPGSDRALDRPARFARGDNVRTRAHGIPGHTRLPAYARGRRGVIAAHHAGWVFPDTNAHGGGEQPQHLYTVAFEGRELWGDDADARLTVRLDLFEPYLERETPT